MKGRILCLLFTKILCSFLPLNLNSSNILSCFRCKEPWMSFNLYKADSLHYKRLKQSEIYGQEFAVSIFSSAELVMVSARACGNNCRWREQGYRCGWSFTSEFQVLRPRCFGACSQALITMSCDHHASLFNAHWSFWFSCAVAVVISMLWSDAVYQYVRFRKCCGQACGFTTGARFTSVLLVLSRVSPKRLLMASPVPFHVIDRVVE